MNPARSFGPALVAWSWSDIWIYVVGPLTGAIGGAVVYELVRDERAARRTGAAA